jgi:hypothetical protein
VERNPDKRRASETFSEVVDVLFNRDLSLLCRIEEMRKDQIIALEERRERFKKMRESLW